MEGLAELAKLAYRCCQFLAVALVLALLASFFGWGAILAQWPWILAFAVGAGTCYLLMRQQ